MSQRSIVFRPAGMVVLLLVVPAFVLAAALGAAAGLGGCGSGSS